MMLDKQNSLCMCIIIKKLSYLLVLFVLKKQCVHKLLVHIKDNYAIILVYCTNIYFKYTSKCILLSNLIYLLMVHYICDIFLTGIFSNNFMKIIFSLHIIDHIRHLLTIQNIYLEVKKEDNCDILYFAFLLLKCVCNLVF